MEQASLEEAHSRLPPDLPTSEVRDYQQSMHYFIENGIRPVPPPGKSKVISATTARSEARAHAVDIYKSYNTLQNILKRREALIRSRWAKKTRAQRKKILLTAWPNMPEHHRPDLRRVFDPAAQKDPDDEDIFKWPHINLEDLLQVQPLLLLLNSRGRKPPHVFSHADQESVWFARQYQRISVKIVLSHAMLLTNRDSAESYGNLLPLRTRKEHEDYLNNHQTYFDPIGGLLVLELQDRVLKFLVECCHLILQDIPWTLLADPTLPEVAEPDILLITETSYQLMSQTVAEVPYRVPSKINTHHIKLLAEAKRSAAEDCLWELREDPGVFAATISDYYTHCHDYISSEATGQLKTNAMRQVQWHFAIWMAFSIAIGNLICWNILADKAEALDVLTGNDFEQYNRERPLPKAVEQMIIDMVVLLNVLSKKVIKLLLTAVPASARLNVSFLDKHVPYVDETAAGQQGCVKPTNTSRDPLLRAFGLLCDGQHSVINRIGLAPVVDEIQRMLERNPAQKKRLSAFATNLFSELAFISNIREVLMSLHPWAANFFELMRVSQSDAYNVMRDADYVMQGLVPSDLSSLILPVSTKFQYPIDRAYNPTNIDTLRRAEANLDAVWKEADLCLLEHKGKSLETLLRENVRRPREIRRTPPWEAPESPPSELDDECNGESLCADFLALGTEPEKPGRFQPETPRLKAKTRGQLSPPKQDTAVHSQEACVEADCVKKAVPIFQISARASKVFRTTFYTQGEGHVHHEIDWKDFLHAMTAMGFAAERLYGSVWHFIPTKAGIGRSIHFHEPHPSSKISFWTARIFGRRFNRAYGWTGEMFSE